MNFAFTINHYHQYANYALQLQLSYIIHQQVYSSLTSETDVFSINAGGQQRQRMWNIDELSSRLYDHRHRHFVLSLYNNAQTQI